MKTDKEKLFEAFEKICGINLLKEENQQELIEENWKNWAVALGIASASLFSTDVIGQSKLKDKIESVKDVVNDKINKDPILRQLEKEGYSPAIGDRINPDKRLSDPNIEVVGNTIINAKSSLIELLESKGIKFNQLNGIIVYKKISSSQVKAKWISYQ
jgi:hypothetical protein